jgi:hypothetical protein
MCTTLNDTDHLKKENTEILKMNDSLAVLMNLWISFIYPESLLGLHV